MAHTQAENESATSYRWVILLFGILAYATSQFARQNYTGVQKFIAADFSLDKAALGVLGSVFFYSYALLQMPWGIAADKFGSRWITGSGILLTALTMVGFATSQSEGALLFWRGAAGVAGAAAYVSMAGGVARWFPSKERGFSQAALGGVGGALGEGSALLLLPVLSIYFASGWRRGTYMVAAGITAIGILCLIFLRSTPANQPVMPRKPFTLPMLGDPLLWCYALLHSACVVGIRNMQAWMALYVADVYILTRGASINTAVVAGGLLATVSLLGRGVCVPIAGKISDRLVKRGVPRTVLVIGWLVAASILLPVLSGGVTTMWVLCVIAVLLGTAFNSFTLVIADASETYGSEKTGSVSAFINMVGQIAGATSLAVSGYIGIGLSTGDRNLLDEYQGIWLSGMGWIVTLTLLGSLLYYVALKSRWGSSVVAPSVR